MSKQDTKALAVVEVSDYSLTTDDEMSFSEILEANLDAGITLNDLPKLKIPTGGGKVWSYLEGEEEIDSPEVDGVIIGVNNFRSYYSSEYGSGEVVPPDCSSTDCINGIGDPGGNCRTCALAQFGSALKGGGQACKEKQSIYFMKAGDFLPTVLTVPPTSLKAIKNYMISLVTKRKKRTSVVTRFSLDKTKNKAGTDYSVIKCQSIADLPKETAAEYAEHAKSFKSFIDNMNGVQNETSDNNNEEITE